MKQLQLFISLWLLCNPCYCQKENNFWAFGGKAGINFNTNPPTPAITAIDQWEGAASVCDRHSGNLLFYSDGSKVWNAKHEIMPNGTIHNVTQTQSSKQACLIVPMINYPSKYYLFTLNASTTGTSIDVSESERGRLYYSVIDMELNGGLGDIVQGQKKIYLDSGLTEALVAIPGDNCDIWIIVHAEYSNLFKSFNVNFKGINNVPVETRAGNYLGRNSTGSISVSGNRSLLTYHRASGSFYKDTDLEVMRFDANKGEVYYQFSLQSPNVWGFTGAAFSLDDSKLYASTANILDRPRLLQYDLSTGDSSIVRASVMDLGRCGLGDLQLAPDGKIYGISNNAFSLSTIHFPDSSGYSCNYIEYSFNLMEGSRAIFSLPNKVPPFIRTDTLRTTSFFHYSCFSDLPNQAIQAKDTTGSNYEWEDGSTGLSKQIHGTGTYWVSYKNSHCSYQVDTIVVLPDHTSLSLRISSECKGRSNGWATYISYANSSSSPLNFTWKSLTDTTVLSSKDSLINVKSGYYSLRLYTPNGCDTTITFYIPEEDHQVRFEADSIVCMGDTVMFQNTSNDYFNSWLWLWGDGHRSISENPMHVFFEAGVYEILLIGENGICIDSFHRAIIVDPLSYPPSFTKTEDFVCCGTAMAFNPLSNAATMRLLWDFGDGSWSYSAPGDKMEHRYDSVGKMIVSLTAEYRACPETNFVDSIDVYPFPFTDLGDDVNLCFHDTPMKLGNKRYNTIGYYQYRWNFDQDTTEFLRISHPGVYHLSVSNEYGCTTSDEIMVHKNCFTDIPNAFSPNGDGINDYFFPRQWLSRGITSFNFKIYNRWGQLVFESQDLEGKGWDGRFNNFIQPVGVYVYQLEVKFENEKEEHYYGNVTLLR